MTTTTPRRLNFALNEAELVAQLPALARALPHLTTAWLTASEVHDQLPAIAGFGDNDR